MKGKDLISVVIPAYNAEHFIKNGILSIFKQSYRPIEIIVINDGSTDHTLDIIESLENLVPNKEIYMKIINLKENKGAANALNVGFKEANGSYICWLSADDIFINPRKLEKQILTMKKNKTLWSFFEKYYIGESINNAILMGNSYKSKILSCLSSISTDFLFLFIIYSNPINGSSLMFHRNCLENYGSFDPLLRNVDADGDLLMRYALLKIKPAIIKDVGVFYTQHPFQTSKKIKEMIYGCDLTRVRILKLLEEEEILKELSKLIALFLLSAIYSGKKIHLAYPFTSEFLINYMINNSPGLKRSKLLNKALIETTQHIESLGLSRDNFYKDVEEKSKSDVFENFKILLRERRKKL